MMLAGPATLPVATFSHLLLPRPIERTPVRNARPGHALSHGRSVPGTNTHRKCLTSTIVTASYASRESSGGFRRQKYNLFVNKWLDDNLSNDQNRWTSASVLDRLLICAHKYRSTRLGLLNSSVRVTSSLDVIKSACSFPYSVYCQSFH